MEVRILIDSVPVPFTLSNLYGGLAEGKGIASARITGLSLEFQVKDVLGLTKSGIKDVLLGLHEIASIEYRKSMWGANIVVHSKTLKSLADVPGAVNGELCLGV